MAKGKYSARAANRMVQTDNEVVLALRAQLDQTIAERDTAVALLNEERRQRHSLILARAEELSWQMRKDATDNLEQRIEAHTRNSKKAAIRLFDHFGSRTPDGNIPDVFLDVVLPLLVPQPRERSLLINQWIDTPKGTSK